MYSSTRTLYDVFKVIYPIFGHVLAVSPQPMVWGLKYPTPRCALAPNTRIRVHITEIVTIIIKPYPIYFVCLNIYCAICKYAQFPMFSRLSKHLISFELSCDYCSITKIYLLELCLIYNNAHCMGQLVEWTQTLTWKTLFFEHLGACPSGNPKPCSVFFFGPRFKSATVMTKPIWIKHLISQAVFPDLSLL